MKNLFRYLRGGILGMCLEYLYRVEYNPMTVMICILLLVDIILDLDDKQKIKILGLKIYFYILSAYVWLITKK